MKKLAKAQMGKIVKGIAKTATKYAPKASEVITKSVKSAVNASKKLPIKNAAANTNVPIKPIVPKVKQQMVASANEQYRKANELDSSGKMKYMRKTGSGPKTILEGDYAAGNYKKGGAISKFAKLAPPYNKVTFADKIAGAKKKTKK